MPLSLGKVVQKDFFTLLKRHYNPSQYQELPAQQHIPEDWNLQRYRAHHKGILGSRGIAPPLTSAMDGQISGQLQALATLTPKDTPPSTH
jgi:hypothetical protein